MVYNSVAIFVLIDNVKYINCNFSGKSYKITREIVENNYPNYERIVDDEINMDNFNKYLESKINDDIFIDTVFDKLFNNIDD